MAKGDRSSKSFTTIKVTRELRCWIKQRAAQKGVPMYQLLEQLLAKSQRGERPWEDIRIAS